MFVVRHITGVEREGPSEVVVELSCGHHRHVRHRPPLTEHPWVLDDATTHARIGGEIECFACGQRSLPSGAEAYRSTRSFDEHGVPSGLLGEHTTKDGVWGRLQVETGELWVEFAPPLSVMVRGRPSVPVVIPPSIVHHVRLAGPVRFHVEFLRVPAQTG